MKLNRVLLLAGVLADAILGGGGQSAAAIAERVRRAVGRRPWVAGLARRYSTEFAGKARPRRSAVAAFLAADASVRRAAPRLQRVREWIAEPPRMQPVRAAREWDVPAIESTGALADWLGLDIGELEWFADLRRLARRPASPLHHYFYRAIVKRSGGGVRMLEAPKPRLKMLQHRILHGILAAIPVHEAAHGFRRGRSVLTFATPHTGQDAVLRMDLADFFPSIPAARVQGLFRAAGYPERVADLLGGICTNATPRAAWRGGLDHSAAVAAVDAIRLHERRHLPQGAPSSPALANLCAFGLDCRLSGLAQAAGAVYTRYADDLAFSGDAGFARAAARLAAHVGAIALEEGFGVNHRKTRLMRPGVRQHLAGLVANEKLNVPREEFDALKATLHNCARLGPAGQNREGHPAFREHLAGRVAWVESVHPARGARLRAMFDVIDWGRL